jgi:FkbM family methyltransferase
MFRQLVWRLYVFTRRAVRSAVLASPLLDRVLTFPLSYVESRLRIPFAASNPLLHDGHRIFYREDDAGDLQIIHSLLLVGSYEPETTRVLIQLLRPGMTMVDVGANIGYYTLLAARAVGPVGHVYAFEPVESTCQLLLRNVQANGYERRVTVVPKAVCDRTRRVRLYLSPRSSTTASLYPDSTWNRPSVDVDAVSLDDFFSGEGWPRVDVVKMDIEGAEAAALKGMRELSARNPTLSMIVEVPRSGGEGEFRIKAFCDALQSLGFSRFTVLRRHWGEVQLPRDIPKLVSLQRRVTVNLLCQKG